METMRNGRPRVVITGLGALTPLGPMDDYWAGLKAGKSGIRKLQNYDASDLVVQIGGEVDYEVRDYLEYKAARRMSRSSQMAQICTKMALEDAGIDLDELPLDSDRMGVSMGCADAGFDLLAQIAHGFRGSGRPPRPTALVNSLPNMPGHYVSVETGATGPLVTVVTACASGTQGVGQGAEFIRTGRSDMVFAGGVDYLAVGDVLSGFAAMTVLAAGFNDNPEAASRPFDADRVGFVLSEGCGMLILESLEHALSRGAKIYAEVLGHAASSDAYHNAAPHPEALGAQKAMRWTLEDAGINTGEIDYINAHGTATRVNDVLETHAIKTLFGDHAYKLAVSSTKSMVGHSMGGSGALEALACTMAIHEGVLPPTINLDNPDPECDLDYVPNEARDADVKMALSNSFGLGGQNACILLGAV